MLHRIVAERAIFVWFLSIFVIFIISFLKKLRAFRIYCFAFRLYIYPISDDITLEQNACI